MADHARLDALRRQYAEHPRRYFAPLASALRRAGDAEGAVTLLRTWLGEQPDHLTGHVILGQALTDLGDARGARAAFERAHAVDDGNVVALGALVRIAREAGDERAAAHWTALLHEADPEPAGARAHAAAHGAGEPAGASESAPAAFELLDYTEVVAPDAVAGGARDGATFVADAPADEPPAPEARVAETMAVGDAAIGTPPDAVPDARPPFDDAADHVADQVADRGAEATAAAGPADEEFATDPVVGLDLAPADPLPAPIRQALPELLDELPEPSYAEEAAAPDEPAAPPPAAPFVTETMAGLLAAQGHTAQALEVYAQLVAQRPDDARLRARMEALRQAPPPAEPAEPAAEAAAPAAGQDADARAADMWRAAFAPLPTAAAPDEASLAAPRGDAELDPTLDDLSFDRFFEAFGDEPDPAPAEPAGDFERWADGLDAAPAPALPDGAAVAAAPVAAASAGAASAPDGAPDEPEADLAEFRAWLRGLDR